MTAEDYIILLKGDSERLAQAAEELNEGANEQDCELPENVYVSLGSDLPEYARDASSHYLGFLSLLLCDKATEKEKEDIWEGAWRSFISGAHMEDEGLKISYYGAYVDDMLDALVEHSSLVTSYTLTEDEDYEEDEEDYDEDDEDFYGDGDFL